MKTAAIAEVLGGRKVLGKAVKKPDDLAQLVRKGLPASAVTALDEKLDLPAARLAPEKTRFDDARVVQHYGVALVDQAGQVREAPVVQRAARIDMQQAARAAFGGRVLGDELGGQRIVEL